MLSKTAEKGLEKRIHVIPGAEPRPGFPTPASAGGSICGHLQFNRRRGEGGQGKWRFVSQGLFRLRQTNSKPLPPGSGNSWDRENLQTPGFRATGALWRLSWPPGREGNSSTGPAAVSTVYPPRGSPIHSAPWDVNSKTECQPQRLDGVELRVAEDRRWGGKRGGHGGTE